MIRYLLLYAYIPFFLLTAPSVKTQTMVAKV